jgi:hypothetical protein
VAVAARAERRLRVVHVQAAQPPQADDPHVAVDHLGELVGRRDVEARREHVAGVEAQAEASVAAGELDQLAQLLERASEGAAGAGRVLEQEAAGVGFGERVRQHLADPRERLLVRLSDRGAGVEHHAVGLDLVAHAQRVDERVGRLPAHLAVLRSRVDQVDGVNGDRPDGPALHELQEGSDVVLPPARRTPLARRLVEHLDRLAAALDAALVRMHEAACG